MEMHLPDGYSARPYRGSADHEVMAAVLAEVRKAASDSDLPTAAGFDATYTSFPPEDCVPTRDAALVSSPDGEVVGYCRTARERSEGERTEVRWLCFANIVPEHATEPVFTAAIRSMERHLDTVELAGDQPEWFFAYAPHPGPGQPAAGQAAWLEALGYEAFQFDATLVRPHLDDIPDLALPDGVEIRPVAPEQIREIWDVHQEAFRGEWDFHEPTDAEFDEYVASPWHDPTLWKIAWDDRGVVGQVKSFINHEENRVENRLRGYTEHISTRADRRNQGVAAALLSASLRELRDRGMTEAALGADVNNPSAFLLYQRLGFQVTSYEAVYRKRIG
jgi:ribosomal protein S18 acetylase RimI-like enzyme